jgi:hypothetical protein
MPEPNGTITIRGRFRKAQECEGEATFAESVLYGEELKEIWSKTDPSDMLPTKEQVSASTPTFKAADATKAVELVVGDSSKTTTIGANMDSK